MNTRYVLRHQDYGTYQGECLGLGFWWPMSEMPEQGVLLMDYDDAVKLMAFFIELNASWGDSPFQSDYAAEKLSIEPWTGPWLDQDGYYGAVQ